MRLLSSTINKLLRETFVGAKPLVVKPASREKLRDEVVALLKRCDGVDTKDQGWVNEKEKPRLIITFSIKDNDRHYYRGSDTFNLLLDDANQLMIKESYHVGKFAFVSDLDEIVRFIRHCKQRLDRKRALAAKRDKVRSILATAILAQVRTLAKQEKFDFMTNSYDHKLKLHVKLSDLHALEFDIPFKHFKKILPQLRSAIISFRKMYEGGIRCHIVSMHSRYCRKGWTTHQSVEGQESLEGEDLDGDSD